MNPYHDVENEDEQADVPQDVEAFEQPDASLIDNVLKNAPEPDNDHYPRYAISGLLPIPLYRQNGNNSFADYNQKDSRGRTIKNFNWYPAFTIMPLIDASFPIPHEMQSTLSEEPPTPEPFNERTMEAAAKAGFTSLFKTAKKCAETLHNDYQDSGVYIFDCLIGYGINDPDKGIGRCKALLEVVLPYRDRSVLPETTRVKNGSPFKGPFLDEMYADVKQNGIARLAAAGVKTADTASVPMRLYNEVRQLLSNNVRRANTILDQTEAEIQNPNEIKRGYDLPNLEIADAPVSTDLYCLAHVNRVELSKVQLEASKNIGEGLANPLADAMNKIAVIAEGMSNRPAQVPSGPVMTLEQVEKLMADQEAKMTTQFEKKLAAATAAAGKGKKQTESES